MLHFASKCNSLAVDAYFLYSMDIICPQNLCSLCISRFIHAICMITFPLHSTMLFIQRNQHCHSVYDTNNETKVVVAMYIYLSRVFNCHRLCNGVECINDLNCDCCLVLMHKATLCFIKSNRYFNNQMATTQIISLHTVSSFYLLLRFNYFLFTISLCVLRFKIRMVKQIIVSLSSVVKGS